MLSKWQGGCIKATQNCLPQPISKLFPRCFSSVLLIFVKFMPKKVFKKWTKWNKSLGKLQKLENTN